MDTGAADLDVYAHPDRDLADPDGYADADHRHTDTDALYDDATADHQYADTDTNADGSAADLDGYAHADSDPTAFAYGDRYTDTSTDRLADH